MKIVRDIEKLKIDEGSTVTIGKFDGVHVGHKKLIETMKQKSDGLKTVVFTFSVKRSEDFVRVKHPICTEKEKEDLFKNLGVDILVLYPLTPENARMEPLSFIKDVLVDKLNRKTLVCGDDFRFGRDKEGDTALLKRLSKELGFKLYVVKREEYMGEPVSSSRIREALEKDCKSAEKMLGRPVK